MKTAVIVSLLSATFGLTSAVGADVYKIYPAHSTVGFAVSHLVINSVHGKFDEFCGSVTLEAGQVKDAKGTIQTKSVDTGVQMRDKDLRGPNFFDVEKYPTISFQTKKEKKRGEETVRT